METPEDMNTSRLKSGLVIVGALAFSVGCSKKSESTAATAEPSAAPAAEPPATPTPPPPSPASTAPAAPAEPAGSAAAAAGMSGTLVADPHPVPLCKKTGVGVTTVTWTTVGTDSTEIHIGSPNGNLWVKGGAKGSAKTGQWVAKGLTIYLQNVKNKAPLTADHTLAKLAIDTVPGGPCP